MTTTSPETAFQNAPRTVAPPTSAIRDPRLDFFRCIAMFIILLAHTPGNAWTSWIPARWGFSDATEMFVFCSGMASAIAFGRTFDRAGLGLGTARVVFRIWQVYWAHIWMFFAIATLLAAIDQSGAYDKVYIGTLNLWKVFADPGPQLVGLFTLTYVPNYFDILPMYMVVLALMPLVVALSRVSLFLSAGVVIVLWLAAQERLLAAVGLSGLHLNLPAEPWSDRQWFFNPFGWQLVFFTGFALMRGWIPAPPINKALLIVAGIIVIANVPLSNIGVRAVSREWFGLAFETNPVIEWRVANKGLIDKSDFGILRYVHFLALAYLGYALAGHKGARLMARGTSLAARVWEHILPLIIKVGQQSLAVFIFSMVLARVNGFVLDNIGRNAWTWTMVNVTGFGLLILCAYGAGWFKSQPWRARL